MIEVAAGEVRAQRTDHQRAGDVTVRHHFAPERGLVRLEVLVRQEPALRLDLLEVGPRRRRLADKRLGALWRSVQAALRRRPRRPRGPHGAVPAPPRADELCGGSAPRAAVDRRRR
ncbi:MAG: hypothetical protein KIT58_00405 [Planctomycetota bacterium]|nr:hypothetical protein [Planctomycetota bacterium]